MYDLNDTIVAVSSPTGGLRSIIRITGPDAFTVCRQIFTSATGIRGQGIVHGCLSVDAELSIDARLYLFFAPHSYTGDTLCEIHIDAGRPIVETVLHTLLCLGLRMAGPGEFTARAYLNGKLDLAQAEAVNEVVCSSNRFQLAAAEQLLAGRLTETTAKLRTDIMDCLSLIEAGLDFSDHDIAFIPPAQADERLARVAAQLEQLLSDSLQCESIIDLPAVGIAGAPNAGKSTLLNALLGTQRSIVSQQPKTTRDVLTGLLTLEHCRCVLFDCAGLVTEPQGLLDELAQQAAIESLRNSAVVLFCVDLSKTDWSEDAATYGLLNAHTVIPLATKADLLCEVAIARCLADLKHLFGQDFLPVSAKADRGLDALRKKIDAALLNAAGLPRGLSENVRDTVALTIRHRHAVTESLANIEQARIEFRAGNEEVAAMLLRSAYQGLSDIERRPIDEQLLDRIFSRFCIGK